MSTRVWNPMHDDGSLNESELATPTNTEAPTTWEVPLFYNGSGTGDLAAVFGVMAGNDRHRFRVLVQRVGVLSQWFSWVESVEHVDPVSVCEIEAANRTDVDQLAPSWPIPNVTLVLPVIRTQAEADKAIPSLLAVKAARREVVLAPTEALDVSDYMDRGYESGGPQGWIDLPSLDAIRVRGGDTPMHPEWVRALRAQAKAAGVEFSLRWGAWIPMSEALPSDALFEHRFAHASPTDTLPISCYRAGLARSCDTLDDEPYPEVL